MKRNYEIRVRLSKDEKCKIENKAKASGFTPCAFLRMLGMQSIVEIK